MYNRKRSLLLIPISLILQGCDSGPSQAEKAFAESVLKDMVPIEGSSYEMGDFIGLYTVGGVPDNKPIHPVNLADFQISAYLTTWANYERYAKFKGIHIKPIAKHWETASSVENRNAPTMAASVTWQDAQDYCHWLGKVTNQDIDLPSEAQWEFVARNRGQKVYFPTDNGEFEMGRNIQAEQDAAPVGKFPPNPLGIYDLVTSGTEWIFDWYDRDYYQYSKRDNPAGPSSGDQKVTRSYHGQSPNHKFTTKRGHINPSTQDDPEILAMYRKQDAIAPGFNFRCVIHSAPLEPNDRVAEATKK
ncbi:formylglycine-generating enzyme family protein [Thorsellia anophelis]|uniref:Formylglycine-generating enzyme, required for sulfatase activity, contains SUMF1/FGE domain n=1 Tax=Thorsellia anophelis DSM 18579 TaxID=1123402 RepID=A0A1I0FH41_9GAMM|nr:SUMF1/EgtB/PvdO family nonheme iron enzyme [Thorsellia anophelis]SET57427.1 Formylglycine-generating enzyme, required for sulfatase activity, contains SUMF1/FGE domain [Thorsellia anophelis DSM 18579]